MGAQFRLCDRAGKVRKRRLGGNGLRGDRGERSKPAAKPDQQRRQCRRMHLTQSSKGSSDEPKVKANDKAYNAALRNLPDKQFDPWRGVR
jgi:hypothetical protein